MNFYIFEKPLQSVGKLCTLDVYLEYMNPQSVPGSKLRATAYAIKKYTEEGANKDAIAEMKKQLPAISWQASFDGQKRSNKNAVPSGLYMLDIDHTDEKTQEVINKALELREEFHIVYIGHSVSYKGVRIVAKMPDGCTSIEEAQKSLSEAMGVEYDAACKDMARLSFMVPEDFVSYLDQSIFPQSESESTESTDQEVEAVEAETEQESKPVVKEPVSTVPQYKGIPILEICREYFEETGGQPVEGERNTRLYNAAFMIRYICDFNEERLLKGLPKLGLSEAERKSIVHSACTASRSSAPPQRLLSIIEHMRLEREFKTDESEDDGEPIDVEHFADVFTTTEVPQLPPIWEQFYRIAPDDFKLATCLCLLPFLGTLGSRLRAKYRGREVHSPSFIVTLEAPQAQGKSFIKILDETCLGELKKSDQQQREEERAWRESKKMYRDMGSKLSKSEVAQFINSKPDVLIRYVSPTMSTTELLRRMNEAQGLHLFAMSTEIDTVYKAHKRDFSNLSDLLRKAFDNDEAGQDYASENTWSGIVRLYYNCIYSGTPKAVRRFFPDVEDGMVSRVLFVTIPDQTFKHGVVFDVFTRKEQDIVNYHLTRLNNVSIFEGEVQPEHELSMKFLVNHMQKWVDAQQNYARQMNDITRDTFCRRSAVIGFRAGMLAYYLWEEVNTPVVRRKVKDFATWIANCALRQFLLRFKLVYDNKSTFKFKSVYDELPDTFTMHDVRIVAGKQNMKTSPRDMIYHWKLGGVLESAENKTYIKIKPEEAHHE